ncbi:hypothetical protein NXV81_23065 [Bacteroides ovatus]|nr:hypothetical protein [Bacteroides ovatus]
MKRQDKVGVVMKDGEQLIPCEYDSISSWWEYMVFRALCCER